MTRAEIEQAEAERRQWQVEETRRILDEDRGRRQREHDEDLFKEFSAWNPVAGLSFEQWKSLRPAVRTARQAFEEEIAPRTLDAFSRAAEERRQRESLARVETLVKEEAEKADRLKAQEERLEEALSPERERLMREWIANHPGKTEADFSRFAWPQLRPNVVAEREAHFRREQSERILASGQYSF